MPIVKKIFADRIVIETNTKSPMLHARWAKTDYSSGNRNVRCSLGTTDLAEAEVLAIEKYQTYKGKVERGEDTTARKTTVEKVAIKWRNSLLRDIEQEIGQSIYPTYIGVVNNYVIPILGDSDINNTSDADLDEYFRAVRIKMDVRDKENKLLKPAKSTLNTHTAVLTHIFEEACKAKQTTRSRCPKITSKGKGRDKTARPSFQRKEIAGLFALLKARVSEGKTTTTRYKRKLLYYYAQIAYITGIRSGTEMENLHWDNIILENGLITISMGKKASKGKMHGRTIPVGADVISALRDIGDHTKSLKLDPLRYEGFVFAMYDGTKATGFSEMFGKLLDGTPLRVAQEGKYKGENRTLYSLRHSFITERLLDGESHAIIQDYCDTSKQMIDEYYSDIFLEEEGKKLVERMNVAPQLQTIKADRLTNMADSFVKFGSPTTKQETKIVD